MPQEIEQLKRDIEELKRWKEQQIRQQIEYPLDDRSIKVLKKHVLLKERIGEQNISGLGNSAIIDYQRNVGTASKEFNLALTVGQETVDNQGPAEESLNTQIFLQNQDSTATLQSFLFGIRKPIYLNKAASTITVTSGGTTVSDTDKAWVVDELAGAYINIMNSSKTFQFARQIASNTATQITIDGTWPATVSDGHYFVLMPVYFGAAQYPWRQLYSGGEDVSSGGTGAQRRAIRLGYGTTSGADVIGIYFGTGSPEGVVTANVGSLYLRTNGGANTTLYIKEANTTSAGWVAK